MLAWRLYEALSPTQTRPAYPSDSRKPIRGLHSLFTHAGGSREIEVANPEKVAKQ